MKKILLLTIAGLCSAGLMAQRSIDLSVESFISPTKITSNTQSGTPVSIHAVLKNNSSTDTVKVGDTLVFQSSIRTTTNQVLVATTLVFRLSTKEILPGDTQHFRTAFTWNQYLIDSRRVNLTLLVWVSNRPDLPLDNGANNFLSQEMDYINPNGFGVSVTNITKSEVNVYPNPTSSDINISLPSVVVNQDIKVNITDLSGKVVATKTFTSADNMKMNIEALENGVYLLNMVNGDNTLTSKVTVAK